MGSDKQRNPEGWAVQFIVARARRLPSMLLRRSLAHNRIFIALKLTSFPAQPDWIPDSTQPGGKVLNPFAFIPPRLLVPAKTCPVTGCEINSESVKQTWRFGGDSI